MKKFLLFSGIALLLVLTKLPAQNSLTPIDSALIGCYPFSGNAVDQSGNGINGIVNGAVLTSDRFGNPNSAYYFAGNTGTTNILVPNFSNLLNGNGVSISFWTTTTGYATRAAFLIAPDNTSKRFAVCAYYGNMLSNSQVYWDYGDIFNNGRQNYTGCPIPAANVWDHWVFVASPSTQGNYMKAKNGVLQNTKTSSAPSFTNTPPRDLSIGGGYDVGNGYLWYEGKLDVSGCCFLSTS